MINVKNPYTPGAGFSPKYLAGRDDMIARADGILESVRSGYLARSVVYYGLRGVGKTVLLNRIEEMADGKDMLNRHIEVKESNNFVRLVSVACTGFVQSLSAKEMLKDRLGKLLGVLKSFNTTWNPEDKTFTLSMGEAKVEPSTAGTGDLANDFTELLVTLGRYAKQSGSSICFCIDEIQYAKQDELEAFITAVHRLNQLGLPVVFFCAGLPKVMKAMGDAKSYSERLFEFVPVDSLAFHAARDAIVLPAEQLGVTYQEDAVEKIFDITRGYPYFIQELCNTIWENGSGEVITLQDVLDNQPVADAKLDSGFFHVRYDRCSKGEKRFMAAMVCCGELPCNIANVARILRKKATSISPTRAQLIDKGLIYSTSYGEIDFTVPQFDQFIRRTAPELLNELTQ